MTKGKVKGQVIDTATEPIIKADAPDLTDHILNEQANAAELEIPEGTVPNEGGAE